MTLCTDFLPTSEARLVTWIITFKTLIVATPTAYDLTTTQATDFDTVATNFLNAHGVANADATRTPSSIIVKDQCKVLVLKAIRQLAGIIQKNPATTNQQRSDLGLTVPAQKSPIPAPAHAPGLVVEALSGNTVKIRLIDIENPMHRGKPDGVESAGVFSFVGAAAPTQESDWNYEGIATRTTIHVAFPPGTVPGAKVWFTAYWINPRGRKGPSANPVGTNIAGGAAMAA